MRALYLTSVTLHVLAAMTWVGGMLFLALVGAPVLRSVEPGERQRLFDAVGARFRSVGWAAIGVLLATGVANLWLLGWVSADAPLGARAFWESAAGRVLGWKLVAVGALLAGEAAHDFAIGPAAGRVAPGSPEARRLRQRAALLARLNAVLAIIVVVAAVRLARGG